MQAAVGLVQLGRLPEIVRRRREIVAAYTAELADIPGLRPVADPPWGTSNFQSFWVEVLPEFPVSRDELLAALAADDISGRRGIMASHRQPAYADRDTGGAELPVTERLTDNTLILPVFHQLTDEERGRVVASIRRAAATVAVA